MSTSHSNPYVSSRLSETGQIRLLKVHPGADENEEVQCELEAAYLEDNPSYVALSYTWGPSTIEAAEAGVTDIPVHTIKCNGHIILTTKNLHDFLRRARHDHELSSQRFWIDAVCINQQDPTERSSQVAFMASIYRSASMVISWLGEEDVHTEEAFALIRALTSLSRASRKPITPENIGSEALRNILGELASDHVWNSLRQFWRRRYFGRAWIIQEVVLAKKVLVQCGRHTINWAQLAEASWFFTITSWARFMKSGTPEAIAQTHSNHDLPLYINANTRLKQLDGCHTLLISLIRARRFECSDPRDKVYAVLGLAEDYTKTKPRLQPIYENNSVLNTYIRTAVQILEDAEDLLLLAHAEGQNFRSTEDLPSWVPDWSVGKGLGLGLIGYKRFAAAADLPRKLTINESNNSLALHGVLLDEVVQIGESKDEALFGSKHTCFLGWISILAVLPSTYHNGQSKIEAFWRTLITDTASRMPDGVQHPAPEEFQFGFLDWLTRIAMSWMSGPPSMRMEGFLEGLSDLTASDRTGLLAPLADKLNKGPASNHLPQSTAKHEGAEDGGDLPNADNYETILNFSSQTRLLRTSADYLGLATTSVRVGDSIWVIPGSRVPLVLRETGEPDEYRLVGGAYIHGFMHGEALGSNAIFKDVKII